MQLADKQVDVVPTPIATITIAVAVSSKGSIVGNRRTVGVRIEIVVDVEAVDVVAAHNIGSYLTDIMAVFSFSGIENQKAVIRKTTIGIQLRRVISRQSARAFRLRTERIDPRVQLHPAQVALLHHPSQRVPIRRGRHALTPRKVTAPRLVGTIIQGIAFHSHLEDNRIHAAGFKGVELAGQIGLHSFALQALKLPVNGLNPRASKLALRKLLRHKRESAKKDQDKE